MPSVLALIRNLIAPVAVTPPSASPATTPASRTTVPVRVPTHRSTPFVYPPGQPIHDGALVPGYPNDGLAFDALPVEALVAGLDDLIARARKQSRYPALFDQLLLPVIHRYAEFVHLLPASEYHHHAGPGGLLFHGVEVMWFAAQLLATKTFEIDETPSVRRRREPQWRIATLLAALLHDIGKPVSDLTVVDHTGDREWNPEGEALARWLERNQIPCYRFRWKNKRGVQHQSASGYLLIAIAGAEIMEFIGSDGASRVREALRAYFVGTPDPGNEILATVRDADQTSVDKDVAQQRHRLGAAPPSPAHQVVRAMRRMIADGAWKPNEPGQPVWVTDHGVFATHPDAIQFVQDQLKLQGAIGVPEDPQHVARLMVDSGLLNEPKNKRVEFEIEIRTSSKLGAISARLPVVRFVDHLVLFADAVMPAPIEATIITGATPTPASAIVAQDALPTALAAAPGTPSVDTSASIASRANEAVVAAADAAPSQVGLAFPDATVPVAPNPVVNVPLPPEPVVRNRRDEVDPSLAASIQRERDRKDPPPATREELYKVLERRGIPGMYLARVLKNAHASLCGVRWHRNVRVIDGRIHVQVPAALEGCGLDARSIEKLWLEAGLVEPGADGSGSVSLAIEGRTHPWLRLSESSTELIAAFVPPASAKEDRPAPLNRNVTLASDKEIKRAFYVDILAEHGHDVSALSGARLMHFVVEFAGRCGTTPELMAQALSRAAPRALTPSYRFESAATFLLAKTFMKCGS